MLVGMADATRDRLIAVAMRLFGERGYAATPVSAIEAAAGLSAGAGSLYRHFPSKEALLAAGVRRHIEEGESLLSRLAGGAPETGLRAGLTALALAGLRRLEQERDLNRILVRDLARFPELLALAGSDEIGRVHAGVARWLATVAGPGRDTEALAVVIIGSVSHYWLLSDVFGSHPTGVPESRYVEALVDLIVDGIDGGGTP
jgi:AcrR family transcriptional regulator